MGFSRACLFTAMLSLGMGLLPQSLFAGPRDHEDGFFLRLSAGAGGASTKIEDDEGDELELSGAAGDVNIAIGGIVSPNLALHGTIFGWSVSDPDVETDFISGEINDAELSLSAIGGGLTYYFMPVNLYLSGSVGFGQLSADGRDFEGESDTGVAVDLTLGKEWWVGRRWGLGIAGGLGLHSVPDDVTTRTGRDRASPSASPRR